MATKNYTTKTAALRATIADVNKLETKKMSLNGKNILDYISDSEFNSYDTRDPQLKNDELDIWNTGISLSEEGHIEVKPFEHAYNSISSTQSTTIKSAIKVIDNEVLGSNDKHLIYWQTNGLTDGYCMFQNCSKLTTFTSDLSSLTNGYGMFKYCPKLESFDSELPSMTNGYEMFYGPSNLTTFSSDLSSLTDGTYMFGLGFNLTSFTSELPSLTDGENMFNYCRNLESFNSDLSSLTNGYGMFSKCSKLTSFSSNLSSLTNGVGMFSKSKLDAQSVANIVHTLSTHESKGHIHIGIGCDNTEADQLLFAQECDCETWQELLDDFSAKNWTVEFQFNGRPTTTYNMRRGETLPIYTKLEEVTDEKHAQYISADGSKFYNIHYFHSTNGSTEGYDVFSSLEEAITTYNVTPKN